MTVTRKTTTTTCTLCCRCWQNIALDVGPGDWCGQDTQNGCRTRGGSGTCCFCFETNASLKVSECEWKCRFQLSIGWIQWMGETETETELHTHNLLTLALEIVCRASGGSNCHLGAGHGRGSSIAKSWFSDRQLAGRRRRQRRLNWRINLIERDRSLATSLVADESCHWHS